MPITKSQKMIFALLTVIITVFAFVLYSLYVVNAESLMNSTSTSNVIEAINAQTGIYVFGKTFPLYFILIIEFCFAYILEIFVGSVLSFKIASKMFNPKETNSSLFEIAIISSTVLIMCPSMSFIASIIYYPYYEGFNIITLFSNFFVLICYNLPFAFFSQLFFIQPIVRRIFKLLFYKEKKLNKISLKKEVSYNS